MKRYANASLLYALIAMAGGVFYREFTKLNGFTGKTTLSVVHTHYFLLGMVVFLLLLLSEKVFDFSGEKTGRVLALYHTGLNITGAALLARGITQVLAMPLSREMCIRDRETPFQLAQLVIVRGKERLCADALRVQQVFHHRPGDGQAVKRAGAPADFVENDQRAAGGGAQDGLSLIHI